MKIFTDSGILILWILMTLTVGHTFLTSKEVETINDSRLKQSFQDERKMRKTAEKKLSELKESLYYIWFQCAIENTRADVQWAFETLGVREYQVKGFVREEFKSMDTLIPITELKKLIGDRDAKAIRKCFRTWSSFLTQPREKLAQNITGELKAALQKETLSNEDYYECAFTYCRHLKVTNAVAVKQPLRDLETSRGNFFDSLDVDLLKKWGFRELDLLHINILRRAVGRSIAMQVWPILKEGKEYLIPFVESNQECSKGDMNITPRQPTCTLRHIN